MDIHVFMGQTPDGRWTARSSDDPSVKASGSTRERCLAGLRRSLGRRRPSGRESLTVLVEVAPLVAGVAEAAQIMGWDKRRVVTYIDRGRFPEPFQSLASGRVWLRSDIEAFAADWRSRRRGANDRKAPRP